MSDRRSAEIRELEGISLRELEAELDEYRRRRRKVDISVIPGPPGIHADGWLRMWWRWEPHSAGPLSSDDSGLLTAWTRSESDKLLLEINVHELPSPARDAFWKEVDHLLTHLGLPRLPQDPPDWVPTTEPAISQWKEAAQIFAEMKVEYSSRLYDESEEVYKPTAQDLADRLRFEGIGYKRRTCSDIIRAIEAGWDWWR